MFPSGATTTTPPVCTLPELVPALSVKGRHVAMVPSRDVLLVTGSEDAEGLIAMAKFAQDVLQKPRRDVRLRVSAWGALGGVSASQPDHPAYSLLKLLAVRGRWSQYYQKQANTLNALHLQG